MEPTTGAQRFESSMLEPIPERRVLADNVYDRIKERIMDLSIPPDTHLNIDQLARALQVSNTPVREALTRLRTEGLVQRRDMSGFRTTGLLDQRELRELFTLRVLLEPAGTQLAAADADPKLLLPTLRASIDDMAKAHKSVRAQEKLRYREFAEADAAFHKAIAAQSGNTLLAQTLDGLNSHAHSYRLYFKLGMSEKAINEHEAILAALTAKDPDAAKAAMECHLNCSLARLLEYFQR